MKPTTKQRAADLLAAALAHAAVAGWHSLTHDSVAAAAGVSPSLVKVRLGAADAMRRAVMREAVKRRDAAIVAQGLAVRDRTARRADEMLRIAASEWVRKAGSTPR